MVSIFLEAGLLQIEYEHETLYTSWDFPKNFWALSIKIWDYWVNSVLYTIKLSAVLFSCSVLKFSLKLNWRIRATESKKWSQLKADLVPKDNVSIETIFWTQYLLYVTFHAHTQFAGGSFKCQSLLNLSNWILSFPYSYNSSEVNLNKGQ